MIGRISDEAERYLDKIIEVRTAQGELMHVGKCVGYTEYPTITVVLPNGRQVNWVASLCKITDVSQEAVKKLIP